MLNIFMYDKCMIYINIFILYINHIYLYDGGVGNTNTGPCRG